MPSSPPARRRRLVEFAVYTPQDPQNDKNKLPPRYLAYLLAAQGQPKWTDLGEAAPIDLAITAGDRRCETRAGRTSNGWRAWWTRK